VRGSFQEQGAQDEFQNAFGIRKHIVIPEPQNAVIVIPQPPITHEIALIDCMLPSVHLDHQSTVAADEIRDIRPDRLLTDKLEA